MKSINISKIVMGVMVTLGCLLAFSSVAFASQPICEVTNSGWYPSASKYMTLFDALSHANATGNPGWLDCTQSAKIAVGKNINLNNTYFLDSADKTHPIKIKASGTPGNPYVIEAVAFNVVNVNGKETIQIIKDAQGNYTPGSVVIDAGGDSVLPKATPEKKGCVITVDGQHVTLRNITVKNVPSNYDAICIQKQNAIMDGVKIEDGGGDGFVFGTANDVISGQIINDSRVSGMNGFAINFGDNDLNNSWSSNLLIPVSDNNVVAETPATGLSRPAVGATQFTLATKNPNQQFFSHKSLTQVCLKEIKQVGTQFRVEGWIVNGEVTSGVKLNSITPDASVKRLQIYTPTGFHAYVGAYDPATQLGIRKAVQVDGKYEGQSGYFKFLLPAAGLSNIIILPEDGENRVGQPSKVINVSAQAGECYDMVSADDNSGGSGQGGSSGSSSPNFKGFTTDKRCADTRGLDYPGQKSGDAAPYGYDTDGDGLYDDQEDNGAGTHAQNCVCDEDETCFKDYDSDDDGIPDGFGSETITEGTNQNPDAAAPANALDDDSDDDGIKDGVEDRRQNISMKVGGIYNDGLLWRTKTTLNTSPVIDSATGQPVACKILSQYKDIGVSYDWYLVTYKDLKFISMTGTPKKIVYGTVDELQGFQQIEIMACRNSAFSSNANFNGKYDAGNYELNPWSDNTDGDKYKDAVDNCPIVPNNTPACTTVVPCYENAVYYTVLPKFLKNAQDPTDGFKDDNDNKIPDMIDVDAKNWRQIETNCPVDTDADGIPDCVENIYGTCNDEGLKYNMADSDSDGFVDGFKGGAKEDVCPMTTGKNDGFAIGKTQYSCDPKKVYANVEISKVISCFMDRDADGVRDCEEDINMNGELDTAQNFAAGTLITRTLLNTIETNPLNPDTDEDSLNDYLELTTVVKKNAASEEIFTNPNNKDTDGDTISDGVENRDGVAGFSIGLMKGTNECTGLVKAGLGVAVDTDPTDADTDADGLTDDQELSGGQLVVGKQFIDMIMDPTVWEKMSGGIATISNPRSKDSDGDGLEDAKEFGGATVTRMDSNPCMSDSDGDTYKDSDAKEIVGDCRMSKDSYCKDVTNNDVMGNDFDHDGIPDAIEKANGTKWNERDSDGDGIEDGTEDKNHNGKYESWLGETNPRAADSDTDSLEDGVELKGGTDPNIADTDGDCIPDGLEDKDHNGSVTAGETDPKKVDSDGDALSDGKPINGTVGGEDLDCNGVRKINEDGGWAETDPTLFDSDFNGSSDGEAMTDGGRGFNLANIGKAVNGDQGGCSLVTSATSGSSMSIMYLLGLAMTALVGARRKQR